MLPTNALKYTILFCFLMMACRRNEGSTKEPIFNNNTPESAVYKIKLANLIKADDDAFAVYDTSCLFALS